MYTVMLLLMKQTQYFLKANRQVCCQKWFESEWTCFLRVTKTSGQCGAGADCGYCHCQHNRPVHPDKKHLGHLGRVLRGVVTVVTFVF